MYFVIDTVLIIGVILSTWLGWSTGFVRSFFSIIAGVLAIFLATKYTYQGNLGFYFIFAIIVLFIIFITTVALKIINFFYLNILDKICGVIFGICIWLIVAVNIIIPTIIHENYILDKSTHTIYKTISCIMQSKTSMFKNYILKSLEKKMILSKKIKAVKFFHYFYIK